MLKRLNGKDRKVIPFYVFLLFMVNGIQPTNSCGTAGRFPQIDRVKKKQQRKMDLSFCSELVWLAASNPYPSKSLFSLQPAHIHRTNFYFQDCFGSQHYFGYTTSAIVGRKLRPILLSSLASAYPNHLPSVSLRKVKVQESFTTIQLKRLNRGATQNGP